MNFKSLIASVRIASGIASGPASGIAIALTLSTAAHAAGDHGHDHPPQHGGVVTEVKEIEYELVAGASAIQLYVRDHGKPVDVAQASARLTLLSGGEKQEIELKPGAGRLEASGPFKVAPGAKAVVVITRAGKPATARFSIDRVVP